MASAATPHRILLLSADIRADTKAAPTQATAQQHLN